MAKTTRRLFTLCLLLLVILAFVTPVSAVTLNIDLSKTYQFNNASVSTIRVIDIGDPSVSSVEVLSTAGDNSDVRTFAQPNIDHIRRIFTTTTGTFRGNVLTVEGPADSTISYTSHPDYRYYIAPKVPTFRVTAPGMTGNPVVLRYNDSWVKGDTSSISALLESSDKRYIYNGTGILYEDPLEYAAYPSLSAWIQNRGDIPYTLGNNEVSLNPYNGNSFSSKQFGSVTTTRRGDTGKYFAGAIKHDAYTNTTSIYALSPVVFLKAETPIVWTDGGGSKYLPMTYVKELDGDVTLSFGGSNPDVPTKIGYVLINATSHYEMNVSINTADLAENADSRWTSLASDSPVVELLYQSIKQDVGDAYSYNITAVGQKTPPSATTYSDIAITSGYGISANSTGSSITISDDAFNTLNNGVYYVYLMGLDNNNNVVALSQGQVSLGTQSRVPMTVSGISNTTGLQNSTVLFTITGTNFPTEFGTSGVNVTLTKIRNTSILSTVTSVTATSIRGSFDIPYNANVTGPWDLEVLSSDTGIVIKEAAFTVTANNKPTIGSVVLNPATVKHNATTTFTITGTNFQTGAGQTWVNFNSSYVAGPDLSRIITITSVAKDKIIGTIWINASAPTGVWNLTVTSVNGGSAFKPIGLIVVPDGTPKITGVTPTTPAFLNNTFTFTIKGSNFETGAGQTTVNFFSASDSAPSLNRTITITSITADTIVGNITISPIAPMGVWGLMVNTTEGGNSTTFAKALTVRNYTGPVVSTVTATTPWYKNNTVAYTITGQNFIPGQTTVFIVNTTNGLELNVTNLTSVTSTKINGTITIPNNVITGTGYSVKVYTIDSGVFGIKTAAFPLMKVPVPTLGTMTPSTGSQNSTVNFVLTGTNFQTEASKTRLWIYEDVADTQLNLSITSMTPTRITGTIDITPDVYSGGYILNVTTVDGGIATRSPGFTVGYSAIPTITTVTPNQAYENSTVVFTITGTNFQPDKTVVAIKNQTTGTALNTTYLYNVTPTKIMGYIMVTDNTPTGFYRVDVTTLDGGVVNKPNALKINNFMAPTIATITPSTGSKGSTVAFTIVGNNFQNLEKTSVRIVDDTSGTVAPVMLYSVISNKIIGNVIIPAGAPSGKYRLEVTTADGGVVSKNEAFTITAQPLPTITSITPTSAYQNSTVSFTLKGKDFQQGGTVVKLRAVGTTINATVSSISSDLTTATGTFDVPYNSATGLYRLDVITTNGGFASKMGAFTVNRNLKPTITSISPNSGLRNTSVLFTLKGTNFQPDGTTFFFLNQSVNGSVDTIVNITPTVYSISSTQIIGGVDIPLNASQKLWKINISTVNGGQNTALAAFTVNPMPKPTITAISPTKGAAGSTVMFTLTGTNFQERAGTKVYFLNGGQNISASISWISPTSLTGTVAIPAGTGKWSVNAITVDGGNYTKANIFSAV
jgi:hypothetical protein